MKHIAVRTTETPCAILSLITRPVAIALHPFNGLFSRTTWVSRHQKGRTILDFNEAEMMGWQWAWGISCTICKSCAPRPRQIITPAPHHSVLFYRKDALPDAQLTVSKH